MAAATLWLNEMLQAAQRQEAKTLVFWRLGNPKIVQALQDFCAGPEWNVADDQQVHLDQVQVLFDRLNPLLSEQEQVSGKFDGSGRQATSNDFPVVFGGKYAASTTVPRSISETLVAKLSATCVRVYTVSRSSVHNNLPPHVIHIPKQRLDANVGGVEDFTQVLDIVVKDWQEHHPGKTLVMYFTLGQHKGENPFQRNLNAARNFANSLRSISSQLKGTNWRVVVTGTDATKASTCPDDIIEIEGTELCIPTYKIMEYNFTYAMSKLGQFYLVANAIADILGDSQLQEDTLEIISKLEAHVKQAGEDGNYYANSGLVSMEELDMISQRLGIIETTLKGNFYIAKGISICYTPLHATPWTEQSFSKCGTESGGSPKAYVLEQIVKRMKNAISIELAANLHIPSH
jgi:hypothetical protein